MSLSSFEKSWVLLASTAILCFLLFVFSRGHAPQAGDRRVVTVTVVPQDMSGLGCASEKTFSNTRCAYQSAEQALRRVLISEEERLAPYATITGELLVIAGVFSSKNVQKETRRRRRRGSRFAIRCPIELLSQEKGFLIRFNRRAPFVPVESVWVAQAGACKVAAE